MNHRATPLQDRSDPPGEWLRRAVARFERPLLLYACRVLRNPDAAGDADG